MQTHNWANPLERCVTRILRCSISVKTSESVLTPIIRKIKVRSMLVNSSANMAPRDTLFQTTSASSRAGTMPVLDGLARFRGKHSGQSDRRAYQATPNPHMEDKHHNVEIYPPNIVKRFSTMASTGVAAEIVRATRRERIEFRYRGPFHLLVICDQGTRADGEAYVERLPRSRLRDVRQKLTFVPAGYEYLEWLEQRVLAQVVFLYFYPAEMPTFPDLEGAPAPLAPRLFFEDVTLLATACKIKSLIESAEPASSPYFDALAKVLAYELVRLNAGVPRQNLPAQGGLAAWQRRTIATYIEEHLDEQISLATFAQLVSLSPYHLCRTFKRSFGMPPHRYHNSRRIDRAKALLANPASMVADIAESVGFSEARSFVAVFRKMTGLTPTAYRRSL